MSHRRLLCSILLLGLAAGGALAVADVPAIPVPMQRSLLNDLNTVWLPSGADRFTLHLVIANGSVFDPPGKDGTALLTGYVLARLFEAKIQALWSGQGESPPPPAISVETGHDGIHLTVTGVGAALPAAGQCLSEVLTEGAVPEELFQKVKDKVALEDLQVEDQPETVALQEWLRLLFSPFPYADTPAGSPLSISAIDSKTVLRFFRRHVIPNRSLLAASTPGTAAQFRTFTSRYFGTWVKSEASPYDFRPPAPAASPRTLLVRLPRATYGCLLLGGEGFRMKHDDYLASRLATRLLQRQLDTIAARRPEYRFQAVSQGRMLGGYLLVQAVSPAEPDPAVLVEIQAAIAAVAAGRFSREEFEQEQQALLREFDARRARPDGRLALLVEAEWYRLGTRYYEKLSQQLADVIREDIQYITETNLAPSRIKSVLVAPAPPDPASLPAPLQPAAAKTWGQETPPAQ